MATHRAGEQNGKYYTYLLHFTLPLAHASHYMGMARDVMARWRAHDSGAGARICRSARLSGAQLVIAHIWEHPDRKEASKHEKRLKREHHLARHCPICRAHAIVAKYM